MHSRVNVWRYLCATTGRSQAFLARHHAVRKQSDHAVSETLHHPTSCRDKHATYASGISSTYGSVAVNSRQRVYTCVCIYIYICRQDTRAISISPPRQDGRWKSGDYGNGIGRHDASIFSRRCRIRHLSNACFSTARNQKLRVLLTAHLGVLCTAKNPVKELGQELRRPTWHRRQQTNACTHVEERRTIHELWRGGNDDGAKPKRSCGACAMRNYLYRTSNASGQPPTTI